MGGSGFLAAVCAVLIQKSLCTHANVPATGQLKQIQEVCPLLSENPSDFFFQRVVPPSQNESLASQWAGVTGRPPWSSDSGRTPLWAALYSPHAEVLTPCVGPLTPHLLSPLMWLY